MVKLDLRIGFYVILVVFMGLYSLPCKAQSVSDDPQILLSLPRPMPSQVGLNMESSLVDIKAVDEASPLTDQGKTGVASLERYGQGVIIDSSGVIATNKHIIGNAAHIYVVLAGGKTFEAKVLRNSQVDLSLIKINAPFALRAISLVDSSQIQIGNRVIAFANAGLNSQRKLAGQVINTFKEGSSNKVELLQMNIPLNPGDSGGPILNEQGALLGLIMGKQKSNPSNSYAIASNMIQQEYFQYRSAILN